MKTDRESIGPRKSNGTGPLADYGGLTAPVLTREEEVTLGRAMRDAIKSGDTATAEALREKMITHNLKLVVSRATRYAGLGVELPDLVQYGVFGLDKAVQAWDPERGNKFSTLATISIDRSIQRSLTNEGHTIRIPAHAARILGDVKAFVKDHGRDPSPEELVKEISEKGKAPPPSLNTATAVLSVRREMFSLHSKDGEPLSHLAVAPQESEVDMRSEIHRTLALLPETEATVVRHMQRIGEGAFLEPEELACLLGTSVKDLHTMVQQSAEKLARMLKTDAA